MKLPELMLLEFYHTILLVLNLNQVQLLLKRIFQQLLTYPEHLLIPQKGSYISKIDYDIIEESRFFRLALELAILKIACKGIPDNYLIKLKSNIVEQELCVNMVDHTIFQNLDNVFHKLLFESVGKQWSYDIISSQMAYFDRFRILTLKALKIDKIVNEHKSILDAIENHDFQSAENIMTKHLGKKDSEKEEILALYPEYFI